MAHIDVSSSTGVSRSTDSTSRLRKLSGVSDRDLLSRVKDLVARERAVTLEILVRLIEIERRRLHLVLGYASMFDYCTRHLGYSSSAASRRIQAARCIRDYPEVYGLLEKNEVNLVTISLVASILNESNAEHVLGRIRGKSQREVEAIMAAYRPPVSMRDQARPVCVAAPAPSVPRISTARDNPTPTAGSEKTPNSAAADSVGGPAQVSTTIQAFRQIGAASSDEQMPPSPRLETKFHVQFLASERFMKKFEKAKVLLSNRTSGLSYEFVLEAALDEFLKDHDPENRKQRREERKEKTLAESPLTQGNEAVTRRRETGGAASPADGNSLSRRNGRESHDREPTRHVSAATRDAVFARDVGRCTYVGATGKRCDATQRLQIDHILPYARGGTNTLDNLRLLCERHNKLEAERVLGSDAVRRFRRRI